MSKRKNYDDLCFTDDFLFCTILENHPEIAKELIERIMGKKIREVKVNKQETIGITPDSKGVRFDVYVEDGDDTIYDVEMQTTFEKDLPLRSRYYRAMIDLNNLSRGKRYGELKDTFIIFICLCDPNCSGRHIYTYENRCVQELTLSLGDKSQIIFLNSKGTIDDVSPELHNFLDYLNGNKTDDPLVNRIDCLVKEAKSNQKWRMDYMTLLDKLDIEHEIGKAEGIEIGKAESFRELVTKKMSEGLSEQEALNYLSISVTDYEKAKRILAKQE